MACQALKKRILANATATSQNITISATSEAYLVLKEKVDITPANDLDKYIYYTDLQSAEQTDIFYNIDRQMVKLK